MASGDYGTPAWSGGAAALAGDQYFVTPGTDKRGMGRRFFRPKEWYEEWSEVFADIEENQIFPDTSSVGVVNADMATMIHTAFSVEQREFSVWRDLDNMDNNCGYVSTALDTITDAALGIGQVGVFNDDRPVAIESKNEDIPLIVEDLFNRIGLYDFELWQIARNTLAYGNEFREIVVDESYQTEYQRRTGGELRGCITRFEQRPWYQMWPKFDDRGNRIGGYIQKGRWQNIDQSIDFEEWQVCHFVSGRILRGKGQGLFAPVRRDWKKLQYLEEGLILARVTRAYPKLLHKIPIPIQMVADHAATQRIVDTYKDSVTKKKLSNRVSGSWDSAFNPTDVTTDFYVTKYFSLQAGVAPVETDVQVLEGSASQIADITDIVHLRDKIIARSRVPRRYLGIEEKPGAQPTPSNSDSEDTQFARVVRTLQKALTVGLRKLINTELLMNGIDIHAPENKYRIKWAPISTVDRSTEAQILLRTAQAAFQWQQVFSGALSTEFIVKHLMKLPQQDVSEIVEEIERSIEERRIASLEEEATRAKAYNNPDYAEATGYGIETLRPQEPQEPQPEEIVASILTPRKQRFEAPWNRMRDMTQEAV